MALGDGALPFRRRPQVLEPGLQRTWSGNVAQQISPFMQDHHQRAARVHLPNDAVVARFDLRYEGAEHLVPDDENAAVVAVDVLRIARMVHPVVRGRVEHRLDHVRQAPDGLRVHEELEGQADPHAQDHMLGLEAQPGQRQPKQPHAR